MIEEWAQVVVVILLGACFGSFLNVVIYRLPRGRSIIWPSSRCGVCRSPVKSSRNLPILSFLLNRGRCSECGAVYSARYFLIELLTPLCLLAVWSVHGWSIQTLFLGFFVMLLIAASFIDLDLRIIPDSLSLGAWGVALFLAFVSQPQFPLSFMESLIGSAIGFLSFYGLSRGYALLTGEEGLGGGDVKLMGLIGAMLGWQGVLTTTLVASLSGAVVGLCLILFLGKHRRYPIPFGPFLAVGAFFHVLQLDSIFGWGGIQIWLESILG